MESPFNDPVEHLDLLDKHGVNWIEDPAGATTWLWGYYDYILGRAIDTDNESYKSGQIAAMKKHWQL